MGPRDGPASRSLEEFHRRGRPRVDLEHVHLAGGIDDDVDAKEPREAEGGRHGRPKVLERLPQAIGQAVEWHVDGSAVGERPAAAPARSLERASRADELRCSVAGDVACRPTVTVDESLPDEVAIGAVECGSTPAVHATPLNHIGLWIDKLPEAVEWLTAQGVRFAPGGIRQGAAGFDITFLHPKANDEFPISGEGVLIELVQAPQAVVQAFEALASQPSQP